MPSERERVRVELLRQATRATSEESAGGPEVVLLEAEGEVCFDEGVEGMGDGEVLMLLAGAVACASALPVPGDAAAGMYVAFAPAPACVGIICSVTVCIPPCTCPSAIWLTCATVMTGGGGAGAVPACIWPSAIWETGYITPVDELGARQLWVPCGEDGPTHYPASFLPLQAKKYC